MHSKAQCSDTDSIDAVTIICHTNWKCNYCLKERWNQYKHHWLGSSYISCISLTLCLIVSAPVAGCFSIFFVRVHLHIAAILSLSLSPRAPTFNICRPACAHITCVYQLRWVLHISLCLTRDSDIAGTRQFNRSTTEQHRWKEIAAAVVVDIQLIKWDSATSMRKKEGVTEKA